MVQEFIDGKMEKDMKGSMKVELDRAMVHTFSRAGQDTLGAGLMASKKGKERFLKVMTK